MRARLPPGRSPAAVFFRGMVGGGRRARELRGRSAAVDAQREFHLRELRTQAGDHPILLAARETQYLKCAILEALD